MPVVIHYFPIRGRVEVMKLLCALGGEPSKLELLDYNTQKTDLDAYPFGQSPRMVDGDIDMVQSNACIRHLARKFKLYGTSEAEMCQVDVIIDGVEDLRMKYVPLIYGDELAAEAKAKYWATHGDKAGATGQRNGGAHFEYLARLLRKAGGEYFVGGKVTAADVAVFDIVDLHLRPALFPDEMKAEYPELAAHHARVAGLKGIKEYLASPDRVEQPNNNKLG
ncbi:MAG: glutathione S-transferase [Monoraphidium minutum]|nr:MAG: glutathione S-transferase [Monoraphidium minutum]